MPPPVRPSQGSISDGGPTVPRPESSLAKAAVAHGTPASVSRGGGISRSGGSLRGRRPLEEEPDFLEPGTLIADKYRIEGVVGQGGMSIVYAAFHEVLAQPVAIKVIRGELKEGEGRVRFINEARAAVRLKSQHVVRVTDAIILDDGSPCMVMERLEGEDLRQLLDRDRTLPVARAVTYIIQALDAVGEAHSMGIVHRDMKPANLFLAVERGVQTIKVLDFGISKMSGDTFGDAADTMTRALLGTPKYMSPEQLRNSKDVDARTDVWAIGVILYELLTGRAPFEGDSTGAVFAAVLENVPVPPSYVRAEIPKGLEEVILQCLRKDRNERFGDAQKLAHALEPYTGSGAAKPVTEKVAEPFPDDEATRIEDRESFGTVKTPGLFETQAVAPDANPFSDEATVVGPSPLLNAATAMGESPLDAVPTKPDPQRNWAATVVDAGPLPAPRPAKSNAVPVVLFMGVGAAAAAVAYGGFVLLGPHAPPPPPLAAPTVAASAAPETPAQNAAPPAYPASPTAPSAPPPATTDVAAVAAASTPRASRPQQAPPHPTATAKPKGVSLVGGRKDW